MDREWEFLTSPEEYKEIVIDHQEEIQQYLKQIDECLKNKTASSITEYLHIMQKKMCWTNSFGVYRRLLMRTFFYYYN